MVKSSIQCKSIQLFILIVGLPIHWVYDIAKLDEILSGHKNPEFIPKFHCPFYTLPVGSNSCYGDQAYALLTSLVENKGLCC